VERQFQMPPRLFESLFRNAELSDSGEEQDSQERKRHLSVGAIDAKESHKSSSDAMFDETVDLSCDVKTEGSGTHFSDCAFQTQIKQLAMEDKSNYETILRGLDLLSCSSLQIFVQCVVHCQVETHSTYH